MAIHKNLEVGAILFPYHQVNYLERAHRMGNPHYAIYFKLLYVHNRRERSSGTDVPRAMKPLLETLGIRVVDHGQETIVAIGCRGYTYHRAHTNWPYPTSDIMNHAQTLLKEQLESATALNEGVRLMEVEFIRDFKEKKVSNRDALFSLQKPLQEYVANETHNG